MLWKQCVFLTSSRNKIKKWPYVWELLNTILLPAALAINILGHSKLDSLEAKGNYSADISAKNAVLKGINSSQTTVMVQWDISTNDNLEKPAREAK